MCALIPIGDELYEFHKYMGDRKSLNNTLRPWLRLPTRTERLMKAQQLFRRPYWNNVIVWKRYYDKGWPAPRNLLETYMTYPFYLTNGNLYYFESFGWKSETKKVLYKFATATNAAQQLLIARRYFKLGIGASIIYKKENNELVKLGKLKHVYPQLLKKGPQNKL